jgi:pyrroloquinoline quinone biosynthesis protein B
MARRCDVVAPFHYLHSMKVIVLGSAAGGGFPQWNCNCRNCDGVRHGTIKAHSRTQSSIAVSANGVDWVLINASPDILTQIRATPALQPARASRDTGIAAVMLMDAQLDHVTGLLMLREGKQLPLYCTSAVWEDLNKGLPLAPVLSHYCGVAWHPVQPQIGTAQVHEGVGFTVPGIDGIRFIPLALKSKAPPYSPHRQSPQAEDNSGLLIENTASGKLLFYAPGLGEIEPHIETAMRTADCLLVDGTMWTDDEMIRMGLSKKRASEMGHLSLSDPGGMIEVMDTLGSVRKILIHINNTNPILDENSVERATLARHGIEVAYDGMEIVL